MVDVGSDFSVNCMMPDPWRAAGTHWYIHFTVTAIYCQLYPSLTSSFSANDSIHCSTMDIDMTRFSVERMRYMLTLSVKNATINDVGLYTCVRPHYLTKWKPTGSIASVGIIRKLFSINIF